MQSTYRLSSNADINDVLSALIAEDSSLESVGKLTDALLKTPSYELMAQQIKSDPACRELIENRYIPPNHDLDGLLTYHEDSLGYIYAKEMKEKGFDPNLHTKMVANSDGSYVELRLSQTHDIWHIITGFDTSVNGEIGLQAFHLTQFPYPLATMLIASTLVSHTLSEPEEIPELISEIHRGLEMGKKAKLLFAQKWEEGWEKTVTQWRKELNIQLV